MQDNIFHVKKIKNHKETKINFFTVRITLLSFEIDKKQMKIYKHSIYNSLAFL